MSKINSSFLDWKWEHVEDLLFWVLASHKAYKASWNVEAYAGDLSEQQVILLAKAQHNQEWYGYTLVVEVISQGVGRESRKLTGCPCHTHQALEEMRANTRAGHHRKRTRGVRASQEIPRRPCFWKGRWASLWAIGEGRAVCQRLENISSPALQELYLAADAGCFQKVKDFENRVKNRLVATISRKTSYHERLPQMVAGAFAQYQGATE